MLIWSNIIRIIRLVKLEKTKLDRLIGLVREKGPFLSLNKLKIAAVEEGICAKQTVQNYKEDLIKSDFIKHKPTRDGEIFEYRDASLKENYEINKELDYIDGIIKGSDIVLKALKIPRKVKFSDDIKLKFMEMTVNERRSIIRAQQRLVYFESIGFNKGGFKKHFEQTKANLAKLNLNIQKAILKLDRDTAANVFFRIDYEHSEEVFFDTRMRSSA